MLARPKQLFVLPAPVKQQGDVVRGVLQPVLVEYTGSAGKAHTGKPVILRDDNVAGTNPVYQCKVHTVGSLVKNERLRALPLNLVGSIT